MDTLSHALWGKALFGYTKYSWWAFFFGALPDLPSFGIYMLYSILNSSFQPGAPSIESLPFWVFFNYNFTHSFVIAFTIIYLVSLKNRPFAFTMLGWPFHICLDFPFHSKEYFPTQIFWPFSDFSIDGIPWSKWYIWWPNVLGIFAVLFWQHAQKKKKTKPHFQGD